MRAKLFMSFIAISAGISFFTKYSEAASNSEANISKSANDACCTYEMIEKKTNKEEENYSLLLPFGYSNRLITLKVGLSSSDDAHEFVLDSGAPTFITDSVVKTHDLTLINSETICDVNQNLQKVDEYSIRKINIGGKDIKNVKAVSSQMVEKMPLLKGRPYSGLLGANTMKNSIWVINYNCREIILTNNLDTLNLPEDSFSTKMKIDELNRPTVSMAMSNGQNLNFIIDVGYNGSLLLPKRFMSRPFFNDSLTFTRNEKLSSGFASQLSSIEYKFLKEITIGEMKLENVKASTSGNNMDCLIGNEFLEDYIVVLDFINDRVTFLPADKSCGNQCC